MEYRIKIVYTTGDSFATYPGNESYLELTWKDLEVAKENLQRIKQQYEYYREINRWSSNPKREKDYKNFPWYAGENSIILVTDDGKPMRMGCFWCGYFEFLESAEIVPVEDTGMKIEF